MLEQLQNIDTWLTLAVNGSHSLWLDAFALSITSTMTWIAAAAMLLYVVIRSGEMKDILIIIAALALCILLADQIASGIFKPLVARYRPSNSPLIMLDVDIVADYRGGRYGFFSSHAANTFAVTTFTALLIRHKALTQSMILWALANCWSRIYLGVHYAGDILCGTICGILVGWSVYKLACRFLPRHCERSSHTLGSDIQTKTGFAIADATLLATTLYASFIYSTFKALFCIYE